MIWESSQGGMPDFSRLKEAPNSQRICFGAGCRALSAGVAGWGFPGPDGYRRHRLQQGLQLSLGQTVDAAQECPLVWPGLQVLRGGVQELGVAKRPTFLLQRRGDEIAEAAFWDEILVGEESVIAAKIHVPPGVHGLPQEAHPQLAGLDRRNRG